MTWRLEWRERALQDVERLDRRTRERIITGLERLAVSNYGDVVPLRGRVREWRILFTYENATGNILVLRVLPRSHAYRN